MWNKGNWRKRLQILHGKLHAQYFRERGRWSSWNPWSERPAVQFVLIRIIIKRTDEVKFSTIFFPDFESSNYTFITFNG